MKKKIVLIHVGRGNFPLKELGRCLPLNLEHSVFKKVCLGVGGSDLTVQDYDLEFVNDTKNTRAGSHVKAIICLVQENIIGRDIHGEYCCNANTVMQLRHCSLSSRFRDE